MIKTVHILSLVAALVWPTLSYAELESIGEGEPSGANTETVAPPTNPEKRSDEETQILEKAANEELPRLGKTGDSSEKWETRELLAVRAGFDAAFTSGSPANQGFSIPLVRLGVLGTLGQQARYRLSIGQTREFASLLLAQMMPVEAFLDLGERNPTAGNVSWRLGLFTPTSHPWWSGELLELPIPDYQEAHKAILPNRDIGTELSYTISRDGARVGVGAFNGSGIFGLNTNNARAFNGYFKVPFYVAGARFELGVAGSTVQQSTPGAINYKSQWSATGYALIQWENTGLTLGLDFVTGEAVDNFNLFTPTGGGVTAFVPIQPWMDAYLRIETISISPLDGRSMTRLQIGPVLKLETGIRIFAYYEHGERGSSTENLFNLRARLAL